MSQTQPRSSLRIHPTPFKPTFLSIPTSPFSPLAPITPVSSPKTVCIAQQSPLPQPTSSAPDSPLSWMWQCHQCHRSYHLGATRRCLDDGHKFCSGTATIKAWRKRSSQRVKRHRACASEFDYSGWKAWGRWRRGSSRSGVSKKKDCWNSCDYPSECRWGRKFGIHTPLEPSFSVPQASPPPAKHLEEGILKPETTRLGGDNADFWGALTVSAKRRKSVTGRSPLAKEVKAESNLSPKDDGEDVDMASPVEASSIGSVAIDMLKDLIKLNTSRCGKGDQPVLWSKESSYSVPILTLPKAEAMKADENVDPSDPEALLDGDFAPLEIVQSRRDDGVNAA